MPRFSANLGFLWTELPLLDRIARAAAAGFQAIELHWPYETPPARVRDACTRHDLTLLALNTPVGRSAGDFGLAALPGREDEFLSTAELALEYCREAGGSMVHVMAGIVSPDQRDAARDTLAKNLVQIATKARDLGLVLLLEPINQTDKPGYFYSCAAEAREIIERVEAENVKLMFDLYHAGHSEEDIQASLAASFDILGHVQIAGFPGRREPDESILPFEQVLQWLDAQGYVGWVGAEYHPTGSVESGLNWKRRWERGSADSLIQNHRGPSSEF